MTPRPQEPPGAAAPELGLGRTVCSHIAFAKARMAAPGRPKWLGMGLSRLK